MATETRDIFQFVREFAARLASYKGPPGEVVFNKDTLRLHSQNGRTPGGIPLVYALRRPIADQDAILQPFDALVAMVALTAPRKVYLPAASSYPPAHPLRICDETGICQADQGRYIIVAPIGQDQIGSSTGIMQTVTIGDAFQGLNFYSNGSNLWTFSS